jgi:hypothetical protein
VVEFTGLDPALVEKMVYSRFDYDVIPEKWQQLIEVLRKSNVLEKPHTPNEFFSDPIKIFIRN